MLEINKLSALLNRISRKSFNSDVWRDIIDYKEGTTLKIFLKNSSVVYIGKLILHEEKGLDSWFVLKDYICSYLDKDEEFNGEDCEYPTTVALNLREVERIELFYCKDTKVFDG